MGVWAVVLRRVGFRPSGGSGGSGCFTETGGNHPVLLNTLKIKAKTHVPAFEIGSGGWI